jgi:hypothetical protein
MSVVYGSLQRVHIEAEGMGSDSPWDVTIYLVDPHRASRRQIMLQDLQNVIVGGQRLVDDARGRWGDGL